MPAKTYTIIQIDTLEDLRCVERSLEDESGSGQTSGMKFQPLFRNTAPHNAINLFLLSNSYNRQLNTLYSSVIDNLKNQNSCGFFVFDDIYTVGYDSLIVDERRSLVFIGQMLNWSREYFNWWIAHADIKFLRWEGSNSFIADFGTVTSGFSEGVLMNSPGYGIFGHWLIDFVPRMALAKLIKGADSMTYLFGPLKMWMKDLVERAGVIDFDNLGTGFSQHGRLIVPSSTNLGYGFFEPINSLAWRSLALSFNVDNLTGSRPASERIFVSRRHWQGDRAIGYYEELEAFMASLDFSVIHPETLSLAEQASVFSQAKIVAGEDGSALHNVIFSAPGTRLGVLMEAGRCNLWHAGICHLLGHQIAYAPLQTTEDVKANGLSRTKSFVQKLLDA